MKLLKDLKKPLLNFSLIMIYTLSRMDGYVFDKSTFYYFPTFRVLYYTYCQGTALQ